MMYGGPLFNNIAASEQAHFETVLTLLNQYGLPDPAAGNGLGVFTNPNLQPLYDDLISQGSQSYAAALLVGGLIEEVDIADLQAEINTTQVSVVKEVYTNLKAASSNHLRAFAGAYETVTGEAYSAQRLSPAEVASILGSGGNFPPGNGNGPQGSRNQGWGNGNGSGSGSGNAGARFGPGDNMNQGQGSQNGRTGQSRSGRALHQPL